MQALSNTAHDRFGHLHNGDWSANNLFGTAGDSVALYSYGLSGQFGAGTFGEGFGAAGAQPFGAPLYTEPSYSLGGLPFLAVPATGAGSFGSFAVVSTPGSGLVFDNTYTASCTAQYIACAVAAEEQLESLFTNSVTINETFNEANEGNNGDALNNTFDYFTYSYAQVKAALLKFAPGDVLPSTDPSGGGNWEIPVAYARMLGLTTFTQTTDDTVNLNTFYSWDYGQDVINGITHELTEGGMGRIGALGGSGGGNWSTMDLFRYNGSGQLDETNGRDGQTTYFSANGGSTLSNQALPGKGAPTLSFNNQYNSNGTKANGGDTADWVQNNVFGSTGGGETLALTQTELEVLQALGWQLSLKQDVAGSAGTWETPTIWSTGSMPIEAQDVYINGVSVSLDSNVIVNSIATSASGILEIGDSTATRLTAVDGTDLNSKDSSSTGTGNAGDIYVYTGSTLQIGYVDEDFTNAGTLTVGKGAGGSGAGTLAIAGSINLDGGGTLALGESGTTGDILNAPSTTGDSLFNVNNTMSGSGLIELGGTFDNQAGGVVDAQSRLQISAGTFTNEGAITAETGATLDFGLDGATQSIDNTGSVAVLANADLAISGNYTASGSGAIYLKGAGSEITSDGSAVTFVNAGSIEADNTSMIGNDTNLAFSNSGTVAVSLSGNVLTINTGTNDVVNTGTMVAGNGGTLAFASNLENQGIVSAGGVSSGETSTGMVVLGGVSGGAGLAVNSGIIAVYGNSDLAISGNYTVTGGGDIGLKGAGADITSNGAGPATFTNASTIDAVASGQIGDEGILSSNDLTFVNEGSVFASGSGVTLTINTGANVVNDSGGLIEAETSAVVTIASAVNTGVGGVIEAATNGDVFLGGALKGDGTISAVTGGLVDIEDGGSFGGLITGSGEVLVTKVLTLNTGASIAGAAELIAAANVTLNDVSLTNSAGDLFGLYANTGETVTLGKTTSGTSGFTNDGTLLAYAGGLAVVDVALVDNGLASVTAGTLKINDGLTGTGTVSAGAGAVANISHGADFAGALTGAGTIEISSVVTLTTGASLSAANVVETAGLVLNSVGITNAAGDHFTLSTGPAVTIDATGTGSTFSNAGSLVANGTGVAEINLAFADTGSASVSSGTLAIGGALSGTGTLAASAGAVLQLKGGGSFGGALSGAGTLDIESKGLKLTTGASLAVSDVVETANLTLAGGAISNDAGDVFNLVAGSGDTVMLNGGGSLNNLGSFNASGAGNAEVFANFTNSGNATSTAASLTFLGNITNHGTIDVSSGVTTIDKTVGATGKLEIGATGTLALELGAGSGQVVDFLAGTGLLDLSTPLDFAGTISGFGGSDKIDLLNTAETSFSYASNVLTVKDGTTTVASLHFTGSSNSFSLASDGHGGTLITFG